VRDIPVDPALPAQIRRAVQSTRPTKAHWHWAALALPACFAVAIAIHDRSAGTPQLLDEAVEVHVACTIDARLPREPVEAPVNVGEFPPFTAKDAHRCGVRRRFVHIVLKSATETASIFLTEDGPARRGDGNVRPKQFAVSAGLLTGRPAILVSALSDAEHGSLARALLSRKVQFLDRPLEPLLGAQKDPTPDRTPSR